MQGTCELCWMMKQGRCPNYLESWWTPKDGGTPILVKDCAPKRSLVMLQELSNRVESLQKELNQVRNADHKLREELVNVLNTKVIEVSLLRGSDQEGWGGSRRLLQNADRSDESGMG